MTTMSARAVLIVDDEPQEVESVLDGLRDIGVSTLFARSGEEALGLAVEHHPALIVSDLDMPGMTGHELMEQLHLNPQTRGIPIILFHTEWTVPPLGWPRLGCSPFRLYFPRHRGPLPINSWSRPTPSGRTADAHWGKPINTDEWVSQVRRFLVALQQPTSEAC